MLDSRRARRSGQITRRTSLNLDTALLDEARQVLGTHGTTETVNRALAEVVRHDKLRRLTEMVFDVDNDEIEAAWNDESDLDEPLQLP